MDFFSARPADRPRVVCFCRIRNPDLLRLVEFYAEDLAMFERLGFDVATETRRRRGAIARGDLLYAWWGASALPVVLAWRLRRRPVVLTGALAFRDEGDQSMRNDIRRVLTILASRLAGDTLAVSGYELDDLHLAGVANARLAYHCVDTDFYVPGPKAARPTAVTIGQMTDWSIRRKGIGAAIEATPIVRRSIPDYELIVAGRISPSGQAWLDDARMRLDLSGVRVRGEVSRDEKLSLLQSAWTYVQASRYEAFGVAAAEAMAAGTVLVHTQGGALGEIVGGTGMLIGEAEPATLAAAITTLLRDVPLRQDLEGQARSRAVAAFSRAGREQVFAAIPSIALLRGSPCA